MRSPGVYRVCRPAGKFRCVPGKDHPIIEEYCRMFRDKGKYSGSTPSGGTLMLARGTMRTPSAFFIVAILLMVAIQAEAVDGKYRYPLKVKVSEQDSGRFSGVASARAHSGNIGATLRDSADWEVAAGQARREILCPKRGFNFALGMRPYFATLTGATKVASRGGEGGFLSLIGHLRIPPESTLWEFYGAIRAWDKVTVRLDYLPWHWGGPGHTPIEANFGGLLLKTGDYIQSDINIASLVLGADYDVSFSRDLIFGPNADLHLIKYSQTVSRIPGGEGVDFSQTILQPAIGAHLKYEPTNTGYFSWFKPFLEGRFSWMSFTGLGLSTWDLGAGVAPPVSRNVDAGMKLGYKQWRMEGTRGRLSADLGVEGLYMDFNLQF
jgi:hypothetical protein